jgi:DNA-binding NtrC family response regulator
MAQHILVVDDDVNVLAVLVEMLRMSGFTVTAADSGVAMREILASEATPKVDAIVLDCLMPGEPSAQLALHAKSLSLPVVMTSGSQVAMQFAEENDLQLLIKPFRTPELLRAISEALDSGEFGQRGA